jgi:hypothetical protein
MMKSEKKIPYSQLGEAQQVAKHLGWTQKQTEAAVRQHCDGANAKERRQVYEQAYGKKR